MFDSYGTSWTVACKSPLFMGFPRQEYWSGWPFPSAGDLPHPGIEPTSPALAGEFFTTEPPGKPQQDGYKTSNGVGCVEYFFLGILCGTHKLTFAKLSEQWFVHGKGLLIKIKNLLDSYNP